MSHREPIDDDPTPAALPSTDDSGRTFDFDVRGADTETDLRVPTGATTLPGAARQRRTGDRFGPYTPRDPLGSGGFGEVWRAWDERGAVVALKILNRATAHSLLGLKTEVRSLLHLGHPGIVAP